MVPDPVRTPPPPGRRLGRCSRPRPSTSPRLGRLHSRVELPEAPYPPAARITRPPDGYDPLAAFGRATVLRAPHLPELQPACHRSKGIMNLQTGAQTTSRAVLAARVLKPISIKNSNCSVSDRMSSTGAPILSAWSSASLPATPSPAATNASALHRYVQ